MTYALHLLIYLDIFVVLALGLNLMVGFTGLMTMAHASFFATGAFAYAVATVAYGWSFVPALLLAMLLGATLSLAIALPSWRFRGDQFVLVSLAAQALLVSCLRNWHDSRAPLGSLANMTNGPYGIAGVPRPVILGVGFDTHAGMAAIATVLAFGATLVSARLYRSPWGRLLRASRDDELAARSLGKNVKIAKIASCAIGCSLAAIAGVIYSAFVGYVDPSLGSLDESILILSAVLIGGAGNLAGPLVGAATLLAVPEILRFVAIPDNYASSVRVMAYGLLLVVVVHLRPSGLAGDYRIE